MERDNMTTENKEIKPPKKKQKIVFDLEKLEKELEIKEKYLVFLNELKEELF